MIIKSLVIYKYFHFKKKASFEFDLNLIEYFFGNLDVDLKLTDGINFGTTFIIIPFILSIPLSIVYAVFPLMVAWLPRPPVGITSG
jgi:hypothetical protein